MNGLPPREALDVEFKSDRDRLSDDKIVEEVVALANSGGGDLYLGVEDDGTSSGLHEAHRDVTGLAILIANKTVPPLSVRVQRLMFGETAVARITVPPPGGALIATLGGRTLCRRIKHDGTPESRPVYPYEFAGLLADLGRFDASAQPVPGSAPGDLDPLERERLRQAITKYRGDLSLLQLSDGELDGALGLTQTVDDVKVPTVTGLLLLGREARLRDLFPVHEVAFQVLSGTDVRVNDFCRWPLLRVIESILERVHDRNSELETYLNGQRIPLPEFDEPAFREALVNAFIHRDWTTLGTIHVQLWDTELIVSNPGGFVSGVTVDNLLTAPPRHRNPHLADCLKRIGLAERTGRGVDRIFGGWLRYGRPAPDYRGSTECSVLLRLPRGKADPAFFHLVLDEEKRQGAPLPVQSLIVLSALRMGEKLDLEELASALSLAPGEARAVISPLVGSGTVRVSGLGRRILYSLNPDVYRAAGKRAGARPSVAVSPVEQTEAVLRYAKSAGRITRREAVQLCSLSPYQATRLLARLVSDGRLRPVSRHRGTYYECVS